jgi:membrane protein implicated in regulation of membrane protease activity
MKKSFFDLLREWKFSLSLAITLVLILWNLTYGEPWVGGVLLAILVVVVAVNLYRTA